MPLSMTSEIKVADIISIKMFKDMKVFLLQGVGSELVIKIDAVQATQIKSSGVATKAIDPSVKMKILTDSEHFALEEYCRYFEETMAFYNDLGLKGKPEWQAEKLAVADLKQGLTFPEPFAKMTKQTIHHLEEAATERGKGNKSIVRLYASSLKASGGLERLGQVVAGDLFNGNTDRFSPNAGQTKTIGPYTFDFKALVNPGNAMIIALDDGSFGATMLDYVDPNSLFKDIAVPLATAERQGAWPGRTLVDKKLRHAFAKDIVSDLESVLQPNKSWYNTSKLGSGAVSRLEAGMVEGAKLLKRRLEAKYNPNRWSAGATDRYALMCRVG